MDSIFSAANPRISPAYAAAAVILAVFVGTVSEFLRRKGRLSRTQSLAVVLLTAYLFLVFASTVFSRTPAPVYDFELIPLWSYYEILRGSTDLFWEDVFNILLLLPIGILIPLAVKRYRDPGENPSPSVAQIGFFLSLAIELLQLVLRRGLCEFDDVFHNTIGAAIGYLIWKAMWNRRKRR